MAGSGEMFHKKNNLNWVHNPVILHEIIILQRLPSWEVGNHQHCNQHHSLATSTKWTNLKNCLFSALPQKDTSKPLPPKFERHTYRQQEIMPFPTKTFCVSQSLSRRCTATESCRLCAGLRCSLCASVFVNGSMCVSSCVDVHMEESSTLSVLLMRHQPWYFETKSLTGM